MAPSINDPVSAITFLNDSEDRSEFLPYKAPATLGLTTLFGIIAAASTGADAIVAATAAGFFAVAGNIIAAAGQRRTKEFVSYLHEEFQAKGVTPEQLEQRFRDADEKVQELLAEAVS